MAITYVEYFNTQTGAGGGDITSGSFSVVTDDIITASVVAADYVDTNTFTISNSGTAFTWNSIAEVNQSGNCHLRAWWAKATASQSMTVSVAGSSANTVQSCLSCAVHTGAHQTTPVPSGNVSSAYSQTDESAAITPTASGSALWFVAGDWAATNTFAAIADCTIESTTNLGGAYTVAVIRPTTQPRTDATAFTIGETDTSGTIAWIAFEVQAAESGATNTDYSPGVGSSVYGGLAALVNPQFASPSADATDGNWTPSTGGDLYACIDETLRSDTDYIQSGTNPSSDSCTVKLGTITDPGTDVGFHLQYAAGAVGSTGQVVVSLRQGNSPGSEIAAWTHTGLPVGSYQEFDDAVTNAQAATITDYADLYLRIVAS